MTPAAHPTWCHPSACTAATDGRHSSIPRHIDQPGGGVELLATCWATSRDTDGTWDAHLELLFTDGAQVTAVDLPPAQGHALRRWLWALLTEIRWDRKVQHHPELADLGPYPYPTAPGGTR